MRLEQTSLADPIVSVATLAQHLRLNVAQESEMLASYLAAAQVWFEQYGSLTVSETEYSVFLNWFDDNDWDQYVGRRTLTLPRAPFGQVSAFQYVDVVGDWQNFTDYVIGGGYWRNLSITIAVPANVLETENIRVDFTAGFDTNSGTIPPLINHGILLLAAHMYEVRDGSEDIPPAVRAIAEMYCNPAD